MKHAELSSRRALHVALAGLVVVLAGCGRTAQTGDSTTAVIVRQPDSVTVGTVPSADTTPAAILREATTLYGYGPEREPVAIKDGDFPGPIVNDSAVPRLRIATATLRRGVPVPAYRIIARIRSEGAYRPMGIESGYSYIWRNSWDDKNVATWVTKVVSSNTAAVPHLLTRDARNHEYTHGENAREPRLVRITVRSMAIGVCIDDPVCQTGHCGYY